jgi:aspartate carbamoyltransferase catalytic subunit
VITESDPQKQSSVKKGESLKDTMRTISNYADVLVMRHPDSEAAIEAAEEATIPVISGGYGNITHPTQGLLDLYTIWKRVDDIEEIDVLITSPDLSRARSGQSLALALGLMGANITYASPSELPTPDDVLAKQERFGANVTEHFDVTRSEHDDLVKQHDFVYLPGCRIPEGDPKRDLYMEHKDSYYISLDTLREAKEETGRTVKLMHSLPRFEGEFDFDIDDTEHALYFNQVPNGVPVRMALLTAMVGI